MKATMARTRMIQNAADAPRWDALDQSLGGRARACGAWTGREAYPTNKCEASHFTYSWFRR